MSVSAPSAVRDVYRDLGPAWSGGPAAAYERLAATAFSRLPRTLAGWRVLDVGAGTGAVSRCVSRAGGWPVALDPAHSMLRQARCDHPDLNGLPLMRSQGEAEHLPFSGRCFDAVVAAFSLSHMARPALALAEMRRVLRPSGYLLSLGFRAEPAHAAKACVDSTAERFGFRPPTWYVHLKELEAAVDTPDALYALASVAGLIDTRIEEVRINSGVDTADDLVRWRLGMAHLASFVAGLSSVVRAELVREAKHALGPAPQPWRPMVLILSSRAPA
jgi:SAM-dependent methyltransferase